MRLILLNHKLFSNNWLDNMDLLRVWQLRPHIHPCTPKHTFRLASKKMFVCTSKRIIFGKSVISLRACQNYFHCKHRGCFSIFPLWFKPNKLFQTMQICFLWLIWFLNHLPWLLTFIVVTFTVFLGFKRYILFWGIHYIHFV